MMMGVIMIGAVTRGALMIGVMMDAVMIIVIMGVVMIGTTMRVVGTVGVTAPLPPSWMFAARYVIRLKHIYNFLCSMLVFTPFS
jgi:hypothetical protein